MVKNRQGPFPTLNPSVGAGPVLPAVKGIIGKNKKKLYTLIVSYYIFSELIKNLVK
jgi:hypothetical protein